MKMANQKPALWTPDIAANLQQLSNLILGVVKELALGIRHTFIPWSRCLGLGIAICMGFIYEFDSKAFQWAHAEWLYPRRPFSVFSYWLVVISASFWGWALIRIASRRNQQRKFDQVFAEAGLKSVLGRVPQLIFDKECDQQTRMMRVSLAGNTLDRFKKVKESIESNLRIYIDDIRETRKKGAVDIVYSSEEMPRVVKHKDIGALPPYKFLVGETRASIVKADIREVPHLLIAGQTGGGKSTFLRQFIATHYLNIPDARFTLIDLKEGLESHLFKDLPNIDIFENVKNAAENLSGFERKLLLRLTAIKEANSIDLDQYLKKHPSARMQREFIVVDEAAEIFLASDRLKTSEAQKARRILSDVARRGRAAGVHLVIATQRPDTKSLDPQIKANLPGVLCFQMANDASSILVLGVGSATDLPPVKGRAIWKVGSKMVELQTPFLTDTETVSLLETKRNRAPVRTLAR